MFDLKLHPLLPPIWAKTAHAQTLLGHLIPSPIFKEKGERIELTSEDGDRLVGRFIQGESNTIVYLFHGLGGTTDATYIHRTALVARIFGHAVIMMNHRGCGEGVGLAKNPYHSGRGEDLSTAIEYGKKRFPKHRHVAIGFSLSGNALLLLLSGRRGTVKPDAAIAVNAPINLEVAAKSLESGFNRIYDIRFVQQCRRDVALMNPQYKVPFFSTLYDFDEIYTGKASGFKSRQDYYETCSTKGLLTEIKNPTIVITAKDDPFVHYKDYAEAKMSPAIFFHAENVGGHMGYLTRVKTPLGTNRWLDYALHESLKNLTS